MPRKLEGRCEETMALGTVTQRQKVERWGRGSNLFSRTEPAEQRKSSVSRKNCRDLRMVKGSNRMSKSSHADRQ